MVSGIAMLGLSSSALVMFLDQKVVLAWPDQSRKNKHWCVGTHAEFTVEVINVAVVLHTSKIGLSESKRSAHVTSPVYYILIRVVLF